MLDRRFVERAAGADPVTALPAEPFFYERLEGVVKWAIVILGGSLPVSVALDNILFGFILLCWLVGGNYRVKLDAIRRNPVALSTLALFALYLVGALYTQASARDVADSITKALRLLLIIAMLPLMQEVRWRERGIGAFQGSMLFTLLLSYLLFFGFIDPLSWLNGTASDPVVFKAHITHNIFMAFVAFLFAQNAVEAKTWPVRILLGALSVAAAANVLLMVQGRSGVVVLLVLFTYFLYRTLRGRGLALAAVALTILALFVIASPGTMLHKRIMLADDEFRQWLTGAPPQPTSSVGQRLDYLQNTLTIIREHPFIGVGTGGFGKAYADRVAGTNAVASTNPHNEFLMMIAQFGIAGFVLLTLLFATQWRIAARLPPYYDQAAHALVLTIAVASALTSTLVDHAEGVFFCYMSGLLFASYPMNGRRAPEARTR